MVDKIERAMREVQATYHNNPIEHNDKMCNTNL